MAARDRIFLAHAREDKARVRKLYTDLKAEGFNPWLDEVDLIAGQIWKTEISKAIREAAVFLACLSSQSVGKVGYVQNEFRLALAAFGERPTGSIYLIPVRLDDCDVPDLKTSDTGQSLRDFHWVDLWEAGGPGRLFRDLTVAFGREPSLPPIQPAEPSLKRLPASDTGSETLLSQPVGTTTLEAYTKWKYPRLPVDNKIQRLLLRDLDTSRYRTLGDLDRVVEAATDALARYEMEKPEWFKAGTDYLTKSLGFVDEDFRERHPFADRTRDAFSQYSYLVRRGGVIVPPIEAASESSLEETPSTYERSVFFDSGEVLVPEGEDGEPSLSVPARGPKMFLRLLPTQPTRRLSVYDSYALLAPTGAGLEPLRLARVSGGGPCSRNKHGALVYGGSKRHDIEGMTQILRNRELWGISCEISDGILPSIDYENAFVRALASYLKFAKERLELELPIKIRAGLTEIEGFRMAVQHNRTAGRTFEPDIIAEIFVEDWGMPPEEILLPFFKRVWEAFGLIRPDQAGERGSRGSR